MSHIRGIVVQLKTHSQLNWSGTDDHLYVGVVGKGGGREFPLAVDGFDDFEKGTNVKYWFGTVWDAEAVTGAKKPYSSSPESQRWNDPVPDAIELTRVHNVYLRKGGTRKAKDDDAYVMDDVKVTLYGSTPDKRTFQNTRDIGLANEFGLQTWLKEV